MMAEYIYQNPSVYCNQRRQNFSLPFGIISYITQHPSSPDGLLKLQKTCKYFFAKNKIVIVNRCVSQREDFSFYYKRYNTHKKRKFEEKEYLLSHLKYWLTDNFDSRIPMKLPKNIYRCNLRSLVLHKQILTMDEMNFLLNGGEIKWLQLFELNIKNENNNDSRFFNKILEKVPKITVFDYDCQNEIFTNKTLEKMNAFEFKSKIYHFDLSFHNIEMDIDISLLRNFIKKNACTHLSYFYFHFKMNNLEIYRNTLQSAIDEMLGNWSENGKPKVFID